MADLKSYLDRICGDIPFCANEVRVELRHHIEQAAAKLEAEGHGPEEALAIAIREFGDPAEIAAGLAEAHRRGGGAMFRRVIAPALIAVGVWCGVTLVSTLPPVLARRATDSVVAGQAGNWPLVPSVYWLLPPTLFLAAHLCASRGGTRRECILVAISPLVVAGPLLLVMIFQQAGTSVFSLGFGVGPVVRGDVTLGTVVMARAYVEHLLGLAGTCLAATWLYFFAVRHMQERPFWLAAEESEPQAS